MSSIEKLSIQGKEIDEESERAANIELERQKEEQGKEIDEESERAANIELEGQNEEKEREMDSKTEMEDERESPSEEREAAERHTVAKTYRRSELAQMLLGQCEQASGGPCRWTLATLIEEMSLKATPVRPVAMVGPQEIRSEKGRDNPPGRHIAGAHLSPEPDAWESDPGWWDSPPSREVMMETVHPPWVLQQWQMRAAREQEEQQPEEPEADWPPARRQRRRRRRRRGGKARDSRPAEEYWD